MPHIQNETKHIQTYNSTSSQSKCDSFALRQIYQNSNVVQSMLTILSVVLLNIVDFVMHFTWFFDK